MFSRSTRAVLTVAVAVLALFLSPLVGVLPASADDGSGVLQGRIVDLDGNGWDGLEVEVYTPGVDGGAPNFVASMVTVEDGTFHVDLPPGGYGVLVHRVDDGGPGKPFWGPEDGLFTVVAGETEEAGEFTFDDAPLGSDDSSDEYPVDGYVRGPRHYRLDNVNVEAYPADDPGAGPVASALTYEGPEHPHGYYQLWVPPGRYRLKYTAADDRQLRAVYYPRLLEVSSFGLEGGGLDDVILPSVDGPSLSGRVTGPDGDPIPFPRIAVFERTESGEWKDGRKDDVRNDGWAYMGEEDGTFTVPARLGATVTIRVSAPGYTPVFLGGGHALPEAADPGNSIEVLDSVNTELGGFELERALGGHAAQDLPYCDRHVIPGSDDGSSQAVRIPFDLSFFGRDYDHLMVFNNGNVTFDHGNNAYVSPEFTVGVPIIAPFFSDVDTRGADSLETTYGVSTDGRTLCVDWTQVGYWNAKSDKKNTFQLLLTKATGAGTGDGDFDITFNYDQVQWESAEDTTTAAAGFSAGTGIPGTFVKLPGSFVPGALVDGGPNALVSGSQGSTTPGRYVFPIRNSGGAEALGGLHGEVRAGDVGGDPVAGAQVQACRVSGSFCQLSVTADDGSYTFAALPTGNYTVSVSPPDGSSLFPAGGTGTVVAGEDSDVDTLVLQEARPMPDGVTLTNAAIEDGVPVVDY